MSEFENNVRRFADKVDPTDRYASFDYCFNYFQRRRSNPEALLGKNLELSCNQLGFYLASWGMLRGSSFLLQRSVKHFAPLVKLIATAPNELWELDVHKYDSKGLSLLMDWVGKIRGALHPEDWEPGDGVATDILVTKVLLGVFGCVPAFDTYFKKGFGVSTFSKGSLTRIGQFYLANAEEIDALRIPTLDFDTGQQSEIFYTRAKVIDMAFFVAGGYGE
ncbi:MAG: hypothetical protein NTX12_08905 [Actinobacteria bacterium]|nr:hypothetical protein [Actinomycetota bacterium]